MCVTLNARQLSADEALARISMGKTSPMLQPLSAATASGTTLAHSASGGEYYIFDVAGGGYIIASGDDEAEALLAEVPNRKFNPDSMAPQARWLLAEYGRQIQYLRATGQTAAKSATTDSDIATLRGKWQSIAPLMTCRWNQGMPYNRYCPEKGGQTSMTGCVATAMAQVIRTIGYANGSGYKTNNSGDATVEFTYTNHDFKLHDLPDEASYSSATGEQIDAVAELMLACGISVNMSYSPSESGAYSYNVPLALKDYFGYGDDTEIYSRASFSVAKWESMIYRELELGRPVYYSGNDGNVGHAFVVDGYYGLGLWHVNWGWGGMSDGYYKLSALTPGRQGIGGTSVNNGYNSGQSMVKAVPPGCDPGVVPSKLSGSIGFVRDGVFSVYYRTITHACPNSTLGAVIADAEGNEIRQVVFWRGQDVPASGAVRMDEYYHDFSQYSLEAGDYRIYPAAGLSGNESLSILEPYADRNYYVRLTVDGNGVYTYSNSETIAVSGADIHLAEVEESDLYKFQSELNFTLVNNGQTDFNGTLTMGLVPDGDTEYVLSSNFTAAIPAGYNSTITKRIILWDSQYNDLMPGLYRVVLKDADGDVVDPDILFEVYVHEFSRLGWQHPSHFYIDNIGEAISNIVAGEVWNHTPYIFNDESRMVDLKLQFFIPGTNTIVKSYDVLSATIPARNYQQAIDNPAIDLPFGIYEAAYVETRSEISDRLTVRICDEVDGVYYCPESDAEVSIRQHPEYAYTGGVTVPELVTVNGKSYRVVSVRANAFAESRELESVDLPVSVSKIGVNAFASCSNLDYIIMRAENIPLYYRTHFAAGLTPDADIYVSPSMFQKAENLMDGHNKVYSLIESVESKAVDMTSSSVRTELEIKPLHSGTNSDFTVQPVGDESNPAASVRMVSVEPGRILLDIDAHHVGESTYNIVSAQPGLAPAMVKVNVTPAAGIDDIVGDSDSKNMRFYDMQGRPISDISKHRGEIIIVVTSEGGRKHLLTEDGVF